MQKLATVSLLLVLLISAYQNAAAQAKPSVIGSKLAAGTDIRQLKKATMVYVVAKDAMSLPGLYQAETRGGLYIYYAPPSILNIDSLLALPQVLFLQAVKTPRDEMVLNSADLSLNTVYYAHRQFPGTDGNTVRFSLKEGRPDTADIDFRKRFIRSGLEDPVLSGHATIMATLIAGGGNTYYTGKGVAWKSSFISVTYNLLLPEADSIYRKYKVSVQNHSYGTAVENFYGADSYAYDLSVNNNDSLLHVFSAGNSGNLTSTSGSYAGIANYANLTGSFKQSKNSLSAGATDSFYRVETLSSRGPAYDGRIKPELVAFGQDGSSGAAALVSGAALLVQDKYKEQIGKLPPSALVRAALINSADDILTPGPDYISGFGSLNTERAVRTIHQSQFFTGSVTANAVSVNNIVVPTNVAQLKVSIAWTDPAASPNSLKALVNDLDLQVIDNTTGTVYYPFVLSSYPHKDSLSAAATTGRDTLNNVEQVVIQHPSAGSFTIRVDGRVVNGTQTFAVVYGWEQQNQFAFTFPNKSDNLYSGVRTAIRWNATVASGTTGQLEISYGNSNQWQLVNGSVLLSNRYVALNVKDTITLARLRMSFSTGTGSVTVVSDTFSISSRIPVNVGYNCADSFQLYWPRMQNAAAYQLSVLADSFMVVDRLLTDTTVTLPATAQHYYAVTPVVTGKPVLRSYTFDYTRQGIGCFINSFYADPVGDSVVNLKAILGTRYQLQQLVFERLYPVTTVAAIPVNTDTITAVDRITKSGIYYYRAKLVLANGRIVYSDTIQVIIFRGRNIFVYPNPLRNGMPLHVETQDTGTWYFELYSPSGQKVITRKTTLYTSSVALPSLPSGVYIYRIIQSDGTILTGKIIITP